MRCGEVMNTWLELFVGAESKGRAYQYIEIGLRNGRERLSVPTPEVETPPPGIFNSRIATFMPVKKVR